MKISREEVQHVAALARLEFSPEQQELLMEQLDRILQYMEKLNQLDTSGIEPLTHVVDMVNRFRKDERTTQPSPDLLLANAPAREKNFFKVPKIIE